MKTNIQKLYDKGFFDGFSNADEVLKDFLFVTRPRGDLQENKFCYLKILFINTVWKKSNIN